MTETHPSDASEYYDRRRDLFRRHFEKGLRYDEYVASGQESHQRRWREMLERVQLPAAQRKLVGSLTRKINILVLSGTWCGDCVRQVPILKRIEEASTVVTLRIVDRDENPELRDELRLGGGARVPVAVFLTENFFECARYGDRPLATYRAMARTQLGPACPIGPAPLDESELSGAVTEWVNEFERVQLMMRLAPHLREQHRD